MWKFALFICTLAYIATAAEFDAGLLINKPDLIGDLVYRGTKSLPEEFPEVGWIGNCTATLVAPNVIFTASHCVTTGKRVSFSHRQSGAKYTGTCTRHPKYNTRTIYNDYAFCLLDSSVPEGSHLAQFETNNHVIKGDKLMLNGFGKPNLVKHYWGLAAATGIYQQDIETCGPANLGSGDSGGSLFRENGRLGETVRKIVGVNSRGNNSCSYYNKTSANEFVAFANEYSLAKGVKLCGISVDCEKPSEPVDCSAIYSALASCLEVKDEACKKAYGEFKACI